MRVEWYGQSAFHLSAGEKSVAIDPFADMSAMAASRGMQFDYPPISGVEADLLLVTHEHMDHNGVEAIAGEPAILRSTAGTLESPLGEVDGDRLRARRTGGHRARPQHDLRVRARRARASATSATSARRACARSSRPRSARSSC